MSQPPQQQRPPPMLTPDERAELHRRHQAQQQAQQAASPNASQPDPQPQTRAGGEKPDSPTLTPGERDGTDRPEKHRTNPQQVAIDKGRDPPIPEDIAHTGGVPGGSPERPMDPPPEGAVIGNMGASAPEPEKTGPTNEQPARQEPGPGA